MLVTAEIILSDRVERPKFSGVRSGYSPHHKFDGLEFLVSGTHKFPDDELHFPGEILISNIFFPSWEYFKDGVKLGDKFVITELNRIVGFGEVQKIDV